MDYIGSKQKLNSWIFETINTKFNVSGSIFFDSCAGSGAVSKWAASLGANIIATDIMSYSQHLVTASIAFPTWRSDEAMEHINEMNALPGRDGFFHKTYSEFGGRLYFTINNARKIDALRYYIETITEPILQSYLLYCSIEAMSRVSNTTGVHGAFLKKIKTRAAQSIVLRPEVSLGASVQVASFQRDALALMRDRTFRNEYQEQLLYIDPPYNTRQYAPNYHLFETFVRDDNPSVRGITGLRDWTDTKSQFCSKKTCKDYLKNMVNETTAKHIFISYSSDGLLSEKEIIAVFPNVEIFKKEQKRFKSDSKNIRNYNTSPLYEYIFYLGK